MKKIRMQTIVFLASFVVVLTLVGSVATGGIVFRDDFEDGSATDGAPVTWTPVPSAAGSFEVIDGDFVLTRPSPIEEMYCYVNQYTTLADTSIRTQARLIPGGWWFGVYARGNLGEGIYISALKNNGKLEIWRFGASVYVGSMLASADVGIDPRAQDVLLRFDVIGNELSAWAWREGDPMPAEPQVTAVHSEFSTGGVGLAADLGSRLSNNEAIFRYVEVYEPTPPTPDFNWDGIVDCADMCIMVDYWGMDEPLYDIAPPPFGDGVVDVNDLILLSEHLFEVYPSAETVVVNDADDGGQVELELGKLLVVTLESNPSTGYRWELIENNESVLKQFGQVEYKPSDTSDSPMVGAGGWEIFRFKAVSTGQMTLELVYHRTWEDVEPLKTFSVQVIVP
jgi:inhibitor of cysteine peptidase